MPLEQSDAIILRVFPWSETSLVCNLFTRDFGKISAIAKGARRPKSPFEAALDLLSVCRVVFVAKSSDSLDILTEAKLQQRFRGGSRNLLRLYAGYYVAELLDRMTDKGEKQAEIYELALDTLAAISDTDLELRSVVLRYELQMLRCTGQLPNWRSCAQCGSEVPETPWLVFGTLACGILCEACQSGSRQMIRVPLATRQIFETFGHNDWQKIDLTQFPKAGRPAVRGVIQRYLVSLLDRQLLLHAYLEELGR